MPVCGNYLFFELPKKIVLNPKDGFEESRFGGSLFCCLQGTGQTKLMEFG